MDYKAFAYFTYNGFSATGLTVTCDIFSSSGSVALDQSVTDLGGGFYSCLYSASVDDNYLFKFKTVSSSVDQNEISCLYADKTEIPTDVWNYSNRTLSDFFSGSVIEVPTTSASTSLIGTSYFSFLPARGNKGWG